MKVKINFTKIVPVEVMSGEDVKETEELNEYLQEAIDYINFYTWHSGIKTSYLI